MSKLKLKIIDTSFAHCAYSNNPTPPTSFSKHIEWDRNVSDVEDLVFYTDGNVMRPKTGHKRRIAWMIEPYVKQPNHYNWLMNNNHLFEYVLINDKQFLDKGENFIYFPFGGCWIDVNDRKVEHEKSKLVSIITSGKRNVPDHFKRHEIIERHKNIIDVMGRGYNPIDPISKGLIDYMFHIAMENQSRDYHFSEKIINPIMVGTIPIYYGMPSIGNYFDTRGIILFNDVSEIDDILKTLDRNLYIDMLPYAKENFKLAQEYILSEDWMYKNIFKEIGIL
jgi:hypothetical protein